jgi:hypothetical protein
MAASIMEPTSGHVSVTYFLASYLGTMIYGVETCYLGAICHGAEKKV